MVDSACAVVRGTKDASCFFWPQAQDSINTVWEPFTGNVAHNSVNGLVRLAEPHPRLGASRSDFVAYANGRFGVDSGAYRHAYTFDGVTAVGNGESALGLHGFSANENMAEDPAIWDDWTVVGSPAVTLLAAATDNRCCPVHLTGSFDAGFPLVLRQDGLEDETGIFLYEDVATRCTHPPIPGRTPSHPPHRAACTPTR